MTTITKPTSNVESEKIIPVCTNEEARNYFKNKGLSYSDITEGDILSLVLMLNREIKAAAKKDELTIRTLHLSKKIEMKKLTNGSIVSCFLYVNGHYFTQRECISFNEDGFIGFAGWADQSNVNPILRAFLKWCDELSLCKTEGTENTEQQYDYFAPVPPVPDSSISTAEMNESGYMWEGMLPLRKDAAMRFFKEGKLPIYFLYSDDTEALVERAADIYSHAEDGGIFGVEKDEWRKYCPC